MNIYGVTTDSTVRYVLASSMVDAIEEDWRIYQLENNGSRDDYEAILEQVVLVGELERSQGHIDVAADETIGDHVEAICAMVEGQPGASMAAAQPTIKQVRAAGRDDAMHQALAALQLRAALGSWVDEGTQPVSRVYVMREDSSDVVLWLPGAGSIRMTQGDARAVGAALQEAALGEKQAPAESPAEAQQAAN